MARLLWLERNNIKWHEDISILVNYNELIKKYDKDEMFKYTYFVYSPMSIYYDMYPKERKEYVKEKFKINTNYDIDKKYIEFAKEYEKCSKSREERFRDDVLRDMEATIERLHSIEYTKVGYYNDNGKKIEVKIDNTEEKIKTIGAVDKLINLSKSYEAMILKEKASVGRKGQRMFDKDKSE